MGVGHLYATGGVDDSLATFARDASTGALAFQGALFDGVGGVDGLDGAGVVSLSLDDKNIYVASGDHGVGVFSRDLTTGAPAFVQLA